MEQTVFETDKQYNIPEGYMVELDEKTNSIRLVEKPWEPKEFDFVAFGSESDRDDELYIGVFKSYSYWESFPKKAKNRHMSCYVDVSSLNSYGKNRTNLIMEKCRPATEKEIQRFRNILMARNMRWDEVNHKLDTRVWYNPEKVGDIYWAVAVGDDDRFVPEQFIANEEDLKKRFVLNRYPSREVCLLACEWREYACKKCREDSM